MNARLNEYGMSARATAFGGLQIAGVTESELVRLSDPRVAQRVAAILKEVAADPEYTPVSDQEFEDLMILAYREMPFVRTNPDDIMRLFTEQLRDWFRSHYTARDQRVMLWSLIDGKPRTEVAETIQCSPGNVGRIVGTFRRLSRTMHWVTLAHEITEIPEDLMDVVLLDLKVSPAARGMFQTTSLRTIGDLVARINHDPDFLTRFRKETQQGIMNAINALKDAQVSA